MYLNQVTIHNTSGLTTANATIHSDIFKSWTWNT